MGGETAADVRFQSYQRPDRSACDINNLAPIEYAQGGRVGSPGSEFLEMRLREVLDIHRFQVGGSELENLGAEQKRAAVAHYVAVLFERKQTPARCCGWHSRITRDFAQREGDVFSRESANNGKSLGQATHGLAAGVWCFCHAA